MQQWLLWLSNQYYWSLFSELVGSWERRGSMGSTRHWLRRTALTIFISEMPMLGAIPLCLELPMITREILSPSGRLWMKARKAIWRLTTSKWALTHETFPQRMQNKSRYLVHRAKVSLKGSLCLKTVGRGFSEGRAISSQLGVHRKELVENTRPLTRALSSGSSLKPSRWSLVGPKFEASLLIY